MPTEKSEIQTNEDTADLVRISVRALVEFILRTGDIDERSGGGRDRDAMLLGSAMHRKIQRSMGSEYTAEVPLSCQIRWEEDGLCLCVEGRADGIFRQKKENGGFLETIDEIKGVMRSIDRITEPLPVHLAQAKCYAFMHARKEQLPEAGVRMTYVSLRTEEKKHFSYSYTFEELAAWFSDVAASYKKWAVFEHEWKTIRRESIRKTTFPYPYRDGQKELAGQVYHTISHEKILFIQAPTGVGKTLSTVFPAVKAMGEGLGDKLFYLTAKTITRTVAAQALDLLQEQGMRLKRIILTAKEKICPLEAPECNPDACPCARGHYDRINEALYSLLLSGDSFSRSEIERCAEQFSVCPFELSLDLSVWMDAVIGDYNYAFHPRSRLKRFFGEGVRGDYLFLIDEAHNLAERGREMFSAVLYKEDFSALKKEVKVSCPGMARALERVNRTMLGLKRECESWQVRDELGSLPVSLLNLYGIMEDELDPGQDEKTTDPVLKEKILDLYFQVGSFLDALERVDEKYVQYTEHTSDGKFAVHLLNVNPSGNLQEVFDKARSSILFSATLLPIDYYLELLSTRKDNYAVYARTVFDPSRLGVMIGTDTSSRYTSRGEEMYRRISRYILETVRRRKGNYMVFFPSYRMLEDVADCLPAASDADMELVVQRSGMREDERESFLEKFEENRTGSLIGLCVMGSIFGEGIDLKRDRLIGVLVIGPGLPMVCTRQEILRSYYDRQGKDGFYYAYQCPGMNRVLQAAGRVIRTEEDQGIVILLDERFTRIHYRKMFPREWKEVKNVTLSTLPDALKRFWET